MKLADAGTAAVLADGARPDAVHAPGSAATPPHCFDRLTALAARSLGVPLVSVSFVTEGRVYVQSSVGLPGWTCGAAGTLVDATICRHVIANRTAVVIADTRSDERTRDDIGLHAAGVVSYLGVPIHGHAGQVVGSLAAGDYSARIWHPDEIEILRNLAALAEAELRRRAEEQLVEAIRFRDVPAPMWVFDVASRRILAVNDAAVAHSGWSRAEFLGLRIDDLRPEAEVPALIAELAIVAASNEYGKVWKHRLRSGELRDVRIHSQPIAFDGRACRVVLALDVTDMMRAEEEQERAHEALRVSENRFRSFFENTGVAIALEDGQGNVIAANRALRRLRGEEGDNRPQPRDVFIHPEDRARVRGEIEGLLRGGADIVGIENRVVSADGGDRWVRATCSRVEDTSQGVHVIAVVEDITAERRLREEGRQREAYFQSLIENSTDIVTILDADGHATYESPSVERLLGYRPEELIGTRPIDLVHEDDRAGVAEMLGERVCEPGATGGATYRFRHRDGTWRWLESTGRNLLDDPQVRGLVINTRDVTEARRLEEELRQALKMEAVGRLAGGVAHDFNNILTAITGHSELLLADLPKHDPIRPDVEEVLGAANRASALTRQLLAFSRKQVLRPEPLDLAAVVLDMERMLRRVVNEDIELVADLPVGIGLVEADRSQIEQVLVNLVVNARDAMPRGGRLDVRIRRERLARSLVREQVFVPAGDYVVLSVTDTGCGIPQDVMARIFEPFFTTKPAGQGTGLGLSTVFGIVKQSGGFIWVASEPGTGTTFEIQLPVSTQREPGVAAHTEVREVPRGDETILLVEDDASVRALADRILRRLGYRVVEAANGGEALLIARRQPVQKIHMLLTDVIMPTMSGSDLAREMRAMHPDLRVLFMSGYSEDAVIGNGVLQAGAMLLEKPFTSASLGRAVRSALDTQA